MQLTTEQFHFVLTKLEEVEEFGLVLKENVLEEVLTKLDYIKSSDCQEGGPYSNKAIELFNDCYKYISRLKIREETVPHDESVLEEFKRCANFMRLYMSIPHDITSGKNGRRNVDFTKLPLPAGSTSARMMALKLIFPQYLQPHSFDDLYKSSLRNFDQIDKNLSKNIFSKLIDTHDDPELSFLGSLKDLYPSYDRLLTPISNNTLKEGKVNRWYSKLLKDGWHELFCENNLIFSQSSRVDVDFETNQPEQMVRSILNDHFQVYPHERYIHELSEKLRNDGTSIHDGADLHSLSRADVMITRHDVDLAQNQKYIALGLIELKIANIGILFDEGSATDNNILKKLAGILRQCYRYVIDVSTVKGFLLADLETIIYVETDINTHEDLEGMLSLNSSDEVAFLPLKYTRFTNGVCTVNVPNSFPNTDKNGAEKGSRKIQVSFQSFFTGMVYEQIRRVETLRKLQAGEAIDPDGTDENSTVSELQLSRVLHKLLLKDDLCDTITKGQPQGSVVSASSCDPSGSSSLTNNQSNDATSANTASSKQVFPPGSSDSLKDKYLDHTLTIHPSFSRIRRFYEPFNNKGKPFRFKPLQVGSTYSSQVLLFDTSDLVEYIPQLLTISPQIANFEKVVLKVYDRTELEFKYWEELKSGLYKQQSLKEYFDHYEKLFQKEVESMIKIMDHNANASEDKTRINISQLISYGLLEFDTYVTVNGPCDLFGNFTITEYLESEHEPLKINEQLYKEGIDQLHTLKELGILHNDIRKENLLINKDHLYFLDFGLSRFVDDDGSQSSSRFFNNDLNEFSNIYTDDMS